jgi:F-type H+-transporting ATPase subunit b
MLTALSSQLLAATAEGGSGGIGALGVDLKALVLQIVTFVIVFWLLKKFALDKIIKTLDERRKTIDDGVEFAREMEAEKAGLDERVQEMLAKAQAKADKLLAQGKTEAAELIKQAEADAAKRMDRVLTDAQSRIEQDIEKARKALEQEVLSLVAEATEAVLGEKLDSIKDTHLIERELKEVRGT